MPASCAPLGARVPPLAIDCEPAIVLRPALPAPELVVVPAVEIAAPPDPLLDSGWAFIALSLEQAVAMSTNIIVQLL
jgi:hypothetical protein